VLPGVEDAVYEDCRPAAAPSPAALNETSGEPGCMQDGVPSTMNHHSMPSWGVPCPDLLIG
jgi:hypothetical protein